MLYSKGCRTVEDLEKYYDVEPLGPDGDPEPLLKQETMFETPDGNNISTVEYALGTEELDRKNNAKSQVKPIDTAMSIRVALALRRDFEVPIPRDEVEEILRTVMRELNTIQRGCVSTIVGG
jgi:DNA polymerase IV